MVSRLGERNCRLKVKAKAIYIRVPSLRVVATIEQYSNSTDGWMAACRMDGWMDGRMDGWILQGDKIQICFERDRYPNLVGERGGGGREEEDKRNA